MFKSYKVLVCGGRDYRDSFNLMLVLDHILDTTLIIHGGSKGADTLAGEWAEENSINCLRIPAKWGVHGKKAGYLRNAEMLTHEPDLVVAFPGGKGTEMMIKLAEKQGVEVRRVLEHGR